jgi:hypothetical protein
MGLPVEGLIDTAANRNVISYNVFKRLPIQPPLHTYHNNIESFDGANHNQRILGWCTIPIDARGSGIQIGTVDIAGEETDREGVFITNTPCLVMMGLKEDLILGSEGMTKSGRSSECSSHTWTMYNQQLIQ